MKAYRCSNCRWITEVEEWPSDNRCGRCCVAGPQDWLESLSGDTLAELLAAGEAVYCESCKRVHSGPVQMEVK